MRFLHGILAPVAVRQAAFSQIRLPHDWDVARGSNYRRLDRRTVSAVRGGRVVLLDYVMLCYVVGEWCGAWAVDPPSLAHSHHTPILTLVLGTADTVTPLRALTREA